MAGFGFPGKDTDFGDFFSSRGYNYSGGSHMPAWAAFILVILIVIFGYQACEKDKQNWKAWDKCAARHYESWCDNHFGDDGANSQEDLLPYTY